MDADQQPEFGPADGWSWPVRWSTVTGVHGDEALATRLRELMGDRHPVFAAATLSPQGVTVTSVTNEGHQ